MGVGPDVPILQTYNSLGQFTNGNPDDWTLSFARKVYGLTGTVNTAGSTITRVTPDGAAVVFTYNATLGAYVDMKGGGSPGPRIRSEASPSSDPHANGSGCADRVTRMGRGAAF